jgi:hypothetical protein
MVQTLIASFVLLLCLARPLSAGENPEKAERLPENPKIHDVKTPYDDITWQDVINRQQKPPGYDSIYLWFNTRDLSPYARMRSVWYYRDPAGPRRIGEGRFWMPAGTSWARTYLPFHPGRMYPAGNYEVDFYVDGRLEGRAPFAWYGPRNYGGAIRLDSSGGARSRFEEAVDLYIENQ